MAKSFQELYEQAIHGGGCQCCGCCKQHPCVCNPSYVGNDTLSTTTVSTVPTRLPRNPLTVEALCDILVRESNAAATNLGLLFMSDDDLLRSKELLANVGFRENATGEYLHPKACFKVCVQRTADGSGARMVMVPPEVVSPFSFESLCKEAIEGKMFKEKFGDEDEEGDISETPSQADVEEHAKKSVPDFSPEGTDIVLKLTKQQALKLSTADVDDPVVAKIAQEVKDQLAKVKKEDLKKYLLKKGMEEEDLFDHEDNLLQLLKIAGDEIADLLSESMSAIAFCECLQECGIIGEDEDGEDEEEEGDECEGEPMEECFFETVDEATGESVLEEMRSYWGIRQGRRVKIYKPKKGYKIVKLPGGQRKEVPKTAKDRLLALKRSRMMREKWKGERKRKWSPSQRRSMAKRKVLHLD